MLSDNSAYTARPTSQSFHTDSQFSSPNLLKQMAGLRLASRRDDYPGHENAKLVEIDSAANAAAYARAREGLKHMVRCVRPFSLHGLPIARRGGDT